jgi:predicted O-linked N-acetylglucosamine transferase (SPINDLY family)
VQALETHDRQAFDVTLFSTGPDDQSAMRARLCKAGEHFVELRGLGHAAMARCIHERNVDILIDLKGATHDTLLPVFAHRCAPVQVSWLGFPGTTGARYIDYIVGDPVVTPLADAAAFSEKIAQLPHCYQPNDSLRDRPVRSGRAQWGVPEGKLLLCGFHQSYKISVEVFDEWCGLLHALPEACLWLLEWNRNVKLALLGAAAQRGLTADRLVFSPVLPLEQHLSRLVEADLYLDAWPCNAHTTASEALWVGVPVVSLRGRTFAQRVAASVLQAVGLPELACTDRASYRATVLALAGDAPRRTRLREHLGVQARQSPLFQGASTARELESLYRRMWERATRGQAPDHLEAVRA